MEKVVEERRLTHFVNSESLVHASESNPDAQEQKVSNNLQTKGIPRANDRMTM
jgi:hypothetical protein